VSSAGRFITLEGVDGAGKSTHLDFVARRLRDSGHEVIVTREPGGTELAERLRELILRQPMSPVAETLLLFAARADHVERVIRPRLKAGCWIVCDRFTDASAAYQGAGKGVSVELMRGLADAVHPDVHPDRTLVFDCAYEVARERLAASGRQLDRFEREDRAFFERVRSAYLKLGEAEPERVKIIDAGMDLESIRRAVERALF
jgi:dTMP kinase